MSSSDYHIVSTWRVEGSVEEVAMIIADGPRLAKWWPSVYIDVREDSDGEAVSAWTKGWLPYILFFRFRFTESSLPSGFTVAADGDFYGRGIWTFRQEGPQVVVTYDWKIRPRNWFLRTFSFALKPIFVFNHNWAMARGEESLGLELARSRASSADERKRIPAPPRPTFGWFARWRIGRRAASSNG